MPLTAILRKYELPMLLVLVLLVTIPFIGQAIHMDAQLIIDWARQSLDHPFWNHIPDYDYYGVHYDEFHDTHPRLMSLYLGLFLWVNDGKVSESLLHLAMIPFPLIVVTAMYCLARHFQTHALLATLILAVSPAFLVNSHLIMTDIPGLAFWLAGLTLFVIGVDRGRPFLSLAGGLLFTLSIFTYYQGLSVLPLALMYAFMRRKLNAGTIVALGLPAAAFAIYLVAYIARYDEFINLSYPFGLPLDATSVLLRLRGNLVLVGGALIFPAAALAIFARYRRESYLAVIVWLFAAIASVIPFLRGAYGIDTMILLPLLLAAGTVILWDVSRRFVHSLVDGLRGIGKQDQLFLASWFIGTFLYCSILLPYPSPRYLLPLAAPFSIIAAKRIIGIWNEGQRFITATILIVASTLALALSVAIAEDSRAMVNRDIGQWANDRFAGHEGTVWFSSGLGFQYYIEGQGYRMLIKASDEPAVGDLIFESLGSNRWELPRSLADRLVLVEEKIYSRRWPITTEYIDHRTSWTGQVAMTIPYGFEGEYLDKVYIYEITRDGQDNHAGLAWTIFSR